MIDGRRANCNLASLGATHRRPPPASQFGGDRFWPPAGPNTVSSHQTAPYALPYSLYGYTGAYSQDDVYPMGYYGQNQHYTPYYPTASPGVFPNLYPYYPQYSHQSQVQGGFGLQNPQMIQYPYAPLQIGSASSILPLPAPIASRATVGMALISPHTPGNNPEQRPPA